MMTTTEVKAFAIAKALESNPTAWGKTEAGVAMATISRLVKAAKCDDAEADQARAELANQSATSQYLIKHGLIAVAPDALSLAIDKAIANMAKSDEELAKLLA